MFWYIRYAISRGLLKSAIGIMPPGNVKSEFTDLVRNWNDNGKIEEFRLQLELRGRRALSEITYKMAQLRLDGFLADYENRAIETLRKVKKPLKYDDVVKTVISDFYYSGYSLSEEDIKILIKNMLDRKLLVYDESWLVHLGALYLDEEMEESEYLSLPPIV